MFKIVDGPIVLHDYFESTLDEVGGIVTFEGRVRDNNQGKKVKKLLYEAFCEMAELEGAKILKEAKSFFAISKADCIHRTGVLAIRDLAIRISVYAKHREAAFLACQYIIDQVKTRVPIWKKEFYIDGETEWVKCLTCANQGIAHHDHFHHAR